MKGKLNTVSLNFGSDLRYTEFCVLVLSYIKNFLQIDETEKRIAAAKQGLIAAKESYRMAVARYEAQVGTNTDVLDAQSAQTLAEASVNGALSAYERAVAGLYGAIGEKNPELLPR